MNTNKARESLKKSKGPLIPLLPVQSADALDCTLVLIRRNFVKRICACTIKTIRTTTYDRT